MARARAQQKSGERIVSTEKEKIFRRIREALTFEAPMPGAHSSGNIHTHVEAPPHEHGQFSDWLPAVGEGFDQQAELFAKNSTSLKTTFHLLPDEAAAAAKLAEIAAAESWKRVASHGNGENGPATRAMVSGLNLPTVWTDSGYDVREMESSDAGISECDALVAQTGSVLVTARSAGGRALSVLPPHHVVLARRAQLLSDLPAAFAFIEQKYAGDYPSFISFITGPSRTGDIERILVLGAHGPKKLTVICW
jgi:L-lactate dehydrogenase complex protein LldG